jgi:lysophospholipid hydrolase
MRDLADAIRTLRHDQLVTILSRLFGTLDDGMLQDVESAAEWVSLPQGGVLFEQGDPGEAAYILVNGRLQVIVRGAAGTARVVGEVRPGETVGEMALFTGEPRSARVVAMRDSDLVMFERSAFDRLMAAYPQALMALTKLVVKRLRQTQSDNPPDEGVRIVGLIPAGPDVPLDDFAQQLTTALAPYGTSQCLRSADVDSLLGAPGIARTPADDPAAAQIAGLIDAVEARSRFVVLVADAEGSPWSRRCVRHADRILLVARAGDDPAPSSVERELLASAGIRTVLPTSLVLLHPPSTEVPAGTRHWLEPRRLARHHHVRTGFAADIERVARFITGRAFGVALSGGGARGFAHVGFLQALTEAGIPIDMIGGTSMGALISAEYALGWDADRMIQQNQKLFGKWKTDLTLPVLAILNGRRSTSRLRRSVGDVRIEDMWLPYFCVSSNLSCAEIVVHRDGPLWIGLRASGGLPGIFPPLVYNGDLLIDGGYLCNLPADIMSQLTGGGITIAVDVSSECDLQHEHAYVDAISGWSIIWNRLNPFARKYTVSSIAAVLQRSSEIASVAMQRDAMLRGVDLYVRMPVQRFGMLQFDAAPHIIKTGYETGRAALAEWLAARRASSPDSVPSTEFTRSAGPPVQTCAPAAPSR